MVSARISLESGACSHIWISRIRREKPLFVCLTKSDGIKRNSAATIRQFFISISWSIDRPNAELVISVLKHLNNCVIYIGFLLNEQHGHCSTNSMDIALFIERIQLHNNKNHKRSSNSNEIIISFVWRFVLFQCAAVSTNSTWNGGGCIHSTRVAYVFILIHNKLGRFHASTAYGRVIHCPTINLNNARHTRALAWCKNSFSLSLLLSLFTVLYSCAFSIL